MRSKCINSTSGRKSVTGNGFSDIDFLRDVTILVDRRYTCCLYTLAIFHYVCEVSTNYDE